MANFYKNLNKAVIIINILFNIYIISNIYFNIFKVLFLIIIFIELLKEFIENKNFIDRYKIKITLKYGDGIYSKILFNTFSLLTIILKFIINIFISRLILG